MKNILKNKITFVIPWYGKELVGGAETQCRRTAENLTERGTTVEVFTTCSKEFLSDWSDYHTEGDYDVNGIKVKRFRVDKRDIKLFDSINYKLMNHISINKGEEELYIKNSINSSSMLDQIKSEKEQRIYIFMPYLYGTTFFGSKIYPEKTLMIPCLHDEGYAYMEIFKETFPKIKGMIFNSKQEKDLALKIYSNLPKNIVAGEGVDSNFQADPLRFKKKFNLQDFLLYAGRKDPQKNLPLLLDYYCKYIEKNGPRFDFVITGPGEIAINERFKNHIYNMLLSKEDLYDAYSAAFLTCQPSLNESFSLSIMESWLSSTPVLVHGKCDVTREHCIQSNGGLYFDNYQEFEECVNYFLENSTERKIMASNGKDYVLNNFSWEKITEKYVNFIESLFV